MSIIFVEPVKLCSPNTNKKCLYFMAFPHLTANAISLATGVIKRACFSVILRFSYFAKVSAKLQKD